MRITDDEYLARFKDRVWRARTNFLYSGFDNPAKTHYVAVAPDVWRDLGLRVGPEDPAVPYLLRGITTTYSVFGIEIRRVDTLPAGQIELRLLPEDEVEV